MKKKKKSNRPLSFLSFLLSVFGFFLFLFSFLFFSLWGSFFLNSRKFFFKERGRRMEEVPEEVWLHIFSYLPVSMKYSLSLTCKQWVSLSSDNIMWKVYLFLFLFYFILLYLFIYIYIYVQLVLF